jgi:hypothetical protein
MKCSLTIGITCIKTEHEVTLQTIQKKHPHIKLKADLEHVSIFFRLFNYRLHSPIYCESVKQLLDVHFFSICDYIHVNVVTNLLNKLAPDISRQLNWPVNWWYCNLADTLLSLNTAEWSWWVFLEYYLYTELHKRSKRSKSACSCWNNAAYSVKANDVCTDAIHVPFQVLTLSTHHPVSNGSLVYWS